ncbi:MAG: Fic family protein [Chthonomonadaceae bacterium]|nr:Fic family protein [Chthonomonadaceae bacterium]
METRRVVISSEFVQPLRPDPRYSLSAELTERAKVVGSTSGEQTPIDAQQVDAIALSVFASSEIEGEGFGQENFGSFLAAVTEPGERVDAELADRLQVFQDQVEAYRWAYGSTDQLTVEFILEAHRRMFQSAKPMIAGRLKAKPVVIDYRQNGTAVTIKTVAPERCGEFLAGLVERYNGLLTSADPLLLVAEFHVDFLAIHPFADGNGRVGRMLASVLLARSGYGFVRSYPLDQVVLDTRRQYYDALLAAQSGWHTEDEDLTPWIEYFVGVIAEQAARAKRLKGQH